MRKLIILFVLMVPFMVYAQSNKAYEAKATTASGVTNYIQVVAAGTTNSDTFDAKGSRDYPDIFSWNILYTMVNDSVNVTVKLQGSNDKTTWYDWGTTESQVGNTDGATDEDVLNLGGGSKQLYKYARFNCVGAMAAGDTVQVKIDYVRWFRTN